jgi:branched-chain amino acid transport system ATP-binding protein
MNTSTPMTAPVLEVRALCKRFGGLVATDQVNLEVRAGEVHALIGPNGAGKTTLVHQLSGTLPPDSGAILFRGNEVTHLAANARVLRGLVRSYQITSIFRQHSVLDNVALAVQARSGSSFRFWRAVRDEKPLFDEAHAILARVGLADRADVLAANLAHGEQRQLEVGLAVATRPAMLLLDEPMAGMGPEESERLIPLIDGLRKDVSILLIEHDMDAVFRLADRISVLVSGRLIATGTPDEIRANADVKRAYLGDELDAASGGHA